MSIKVSDNNWFAGLDDAGPLMGRVAATFD